MLLFASALRCPLQRSSPQRRPHCHTPRRIVTSRSPPHRSPVNSSAQRRIAIGASPPRARWNDPRTTIPLRGARIRRDLLVKRSGTAAVHPGWVPPRFLLFGWIPAITSGKSFSGGCRWAVTSIGYGVVDSALQDRSRGRRPAYRHAL